MTGAELMTRAATILQDADHVRWPLAELCNWINDGQKAIVLAKPSANAQTVTLSLIAGTRQTLGSASYLLLLRITRNLKSGESPPAGSYRAIRPVTRETLDTSEPNWHDPIYVPRKREVRQYVYDEAQPREFYVYPGNDGSGLIESVLSVLPTALAATGDVDSLDSYGNTITLPEPYSVPLLDYVLYRAFGKDDVAGDSSRAQMHYQSFAQAVGIKVQVEGAYSPNARAKVAST